MAIIVKATARCDGWMNSKYKNTPCTAAEGSCASIGVELEVSQRQISDVSGDNRDATVLTVVNEKGYHFPEHRDTTVQCPVCFAKERETHSSGESASKSNKTSYRSFW